MGLVAAVAADNRRDGRFDVLFGTVALRMTLLATDGTVHNLFLSLNTGEDSELFLLVSDTNRRIDIHELFDVSFTLLHLLLIFTRNEEVAILITDYLSLSAFLAVLANAFAASFNFDLIEFLEFFLCMTTRTNHKRHQVLLGVLLEGNKHLSLELLLGNEGLHNG